MILLYQEKLVEKLAENVLEVSPYSAATFGVLILVLILGIIWLAMLYKKERSYNEALVKKVIDTNTIYTENLAALREKLKNPIYQEIKNDIRDLDDRLSDIRSLIESI